MTQFVAPPRRQTNNAAEQRRRLSVHTLGCKINTFESELIAQGLENRSWQRVDTDQAADLCIINTCTVTKEADRQARQLIRRTIRKNPDARVVVTGCYAQMAPDVCRSIKGVDHVVDNKNKLNIAALQDYWEDASKIDCFSDDDRQTGMSTPILHGMQGRARAFIQVQQGCDQGCTFCIIHKARGPSRSLPQSHVVQQADYLVKRGYREIVICGVDLGSYGLEWEHAEHNLADLIHRLAKLEGDFRLRISSIDPLHIDESMITAIAENQRVCRHVHLSMQSADNLILKRMKRRASREIIYERVRRLREGIPSVVLSADILVGFPTEKENHFRQTLQAVEDLGIAFVHVFSYSARPGTPAALIPDQVPLAERKERASCIRAAASVVRQKLAQDKLGHHERVLVEAVEEGKQGLRVKARTGDYFITEFDANNVSQGEWVLVKINGYDDPKLLAEKLN